MELKQVHETSKPSNVGSPNQGSTCSSLLFNIMINATVEKVKDRIGKSLHADDGALWIRGRNPEY